ncbi:MAG: class I adenylate-forming enzyme family protein [Planctomycetota bacterium]|nr:class I adenylate-forming enzyme family protein [Planctomycetota bacterium]
MLYARWRQVAAFHGARVALVEYRSGRRWTFGELAGLAESGAVTGEVARPAGGTAEFVVTVLRAWRDGRPVCPLDQGQVLPALPALPVGVVHLKLTSATTGASRLVAFTEEQLAADAGQIVEAMGLRPEWPNLAVVSLAHSYGFSSLVLPLLLHGVPLILCDGPMPESVRRAAAGWPDLTLAAVPALWRSWHEANAIPETVRLAVSAGAPLPVALESAIHARSGLKVHNFYGATECGGIAYDPTPEPRTDEGWVGRPMPGVTVSVSADGCLEVRGAAVGIGYLPADPVHLGHGRYHTRDLARVGPDGVRLLGRASDLINVAGRKVVPDAVEAVLAGHPGIRGCVVFGVPDGDAARHERVVAVVVADQADVPDSELRSLVMRSLPSWQLPREWVRVAEIPANARGKVSRAAWRERFLAGDLGGPGPGPGPGRGAAVSVRSGQELEQERGPGPGAGQAGGR